MRSNSIKFGLESDCAPPPSQTSVRSNSRKSIKVSKIDSLARTNNASEYKLSAYGLSHINLINLFDSGSDSRVYNVSSFLHMVILAIVTGQIPFGGREVRFVRGALSMTQKQFADLICVKPLTVIRWESSASKIPFADACTISGYLIDVLNLKQTFSESMNSISRHYRRPFGQNIDGHKGDFYIYFDGNNFIISERRPLNEVCITPDFTVSKDTVERSFYNTSSRHNFIVLGGGNEASSPKIVA